MNENLISLIEKYKGNDDKCRKYLEGLKWPDGVKCPKCNSVKISRIVKYHIFECSSCNRQFSVTVDTIFHDSHLPLWKWLIAVYLMVESKKGISALQLKRTLKIAYKTAWYLCHRIRKSTEETPNKPKLTGIVEVDETYVGGKYDHRRKRAPHDKQPVIGLLQRDGTFEAKKIRTTSKKILVGVVRDRVANDATVMTDELPAYKSLDNIFHHEKINHRKDEWVRGKVYTNGVESAWSLFKRSIVGSYHQISEKHMDAYLDEFEWRFNNRNNEYLFRDTLIRLLNAPKMEFKELIKKSA